jgi:hypothetical protein
VDEADELTLKIARCLEVDWQYVERVEAWNVERVAEVRTAGRAAGRLLGYKIATVQAERDDEDRVTVVVAVREAPNGEDDARMRERSLLLLDDFWSRVRPSGGEEE